MLLNSKSEIRVVDDARSRVKVSSKSRYPLELNVAELFKKYGANRILFCTFTFRFKIWESEECQKRWNSLNTNILKKHFICGVVVKELHKDGGFHLHCVLVVPFEFKLHEQFWSDINNKYYARCDVNLRNLWNIVRKSAFTYGFGRIECLPARKGGQALSRYISKYLSKALLDRKLCGQKLKSVRLVNYLGNISKKSRILSWGEFKRVYKKTRLVESYKRMKFRMLFIVGQSTVNTWRWRVAGTGYSWIGAGYRWRRVLMLVEKFVNDNKLAQSQLSHRMFTLDNLVHIIFNCNKSSQSRMIDALILKDNQISKMRWIQTFKCSPVNKIQTFDFSEIDIDDDTKYSKWGYSASEFIYGQQSIVHAVQSINSYISNLFNFKNPLIINYFKTEDYDVTNQAELPEAHFQLALSYNFCLLDYMTSNGSESDFYYNENT